MSTTPADTLEDLKSGIAFPVEITSIKPQIRNKERVNLYTDEQFLIGVHQTVAEECNICRGTMCTEELFEELISRDTDSKVRDKILDYLSRRNHSRTELYRKCRQKGYDEHSIQLTLDKLEERGWINDASFAEEFVQQKLKQKWGPQKISAALYQKGVNKHHINNALDYIFPDDEVLTLMLAALSKKKPALRREKDEIKRKQKLYNFLASRGFYSAQISKHLDSLLNSL